jgi:hypothetical protein
MDSAMDPNGRILGFLNRTIIIIMTMALKILNDNKHSTFPLFVNSEMQFTMPSLVPLRLTAAP